MQHSSPCYLLMTFIYVTFHRLDGQEGGKYPTGMQATKETVSDSSPTKTLLRRRFLAASNVHIIFFYAVAYVAADFLSQRYAAGAPSISFWNPAAGLGFILVGMHGRRFAVIIPFVALFSSLLLKQDSEPLGIAALEGLIVGGAYALAARFLASPGSRFEARLESVSSLLILLVTAVVSSATAAVGYFSMLTLADSITLDAALGLAVRYWIADLIGIAIVVPLGLIFLQRRLTLHVTATAASQLFVTVLLLIIAIRFREYGRFPYFYFLFFPVIWIALVSGIEGVAGTLGLIQIGMLVAVAFLKMDYLDVSDFQARMVALTATGLVAGALVTERRLFEEGTRKRQEALAQVAMRGGMGELGAAIAHEVNQPLSAAGVFAGLVVDSLSAETLRDQSTLENAKKVVRQIERGSQVIKRLRALVKLSKDDQVSTDVGTLLEEVKELAHADATRQCIELRISVDGRLPRITVDRLQVEQALLNIVKNAMDAITSANSAERIVAMYGRESTKGGIEIGVIDTGPGFPAGFSLDRLQPFTSKKDDGLGVGLALCRSIAAANGAELRIELAGPGAIVSMTFDADRKVSNG